MSTKEDMSAFWNNKNASQTLKDYGGTISEEFATSYLIKKRFSEEHENGDIYINDIEYYPMGTTQNTQINLERLFENGFSTENSSMREPQNIFSYIHLLLFYKIFYDIFPQVFPSFLKLYNLSRLHSILFSTYIALIIQNLLYRLMYLYNHQNIKNVLYIFRVEGVCGSKSIISDIRDFNRDSS